MRLRPRGTGEQLVGFLRAAVIGLCGGLASLGFRSATDWVQKLIGLGGEVLEGARVNILAGARHVGSETPWLMVLIPAAGGLAAALVHRFCVRGESGTGLSDVMEAVSLRSGPIRLRTALMRAASSLGIIATGGSVGREGPIITISAAASSTLTRLLRAPARDRGLLLGCGVAAGFAAAYGAPIAGALFAMEVVLGNFAVELFAPVVIASVTSTLFTWHLRGNEPLYQMPHYQLETLAELVPYLFLGVVAGFVAVGLQRLLSLSERFFQSLPGDRIWKTVVGGALIGGIALAFPEVCGNGYEALSELLNGRGPRFEEAEWGHLVLILVALALVKAFGTAITVGSGGAGGVFTPSLFIGAGLGGAVGVLVNHVAPDISGDYGGYALVGMGCVVAGTTRAPIMAIVVMYELTGDYGIVAPLMLGCVASSVVARAIYEPSIYTEELRARGVTQPVGLEETVLVTTRVGDVMREDPMVWVGRSMTYAEIVPLASAARVSVVYVCDDLRRLRGAIRVQSLIDLASFGDLGPGIVAEDLAAPVEAVLRGDRLSDVFDQFGRSDIDERPVVDDEQSLHLRGVVTRRDVMAALHLEVLKTQNLRAKFVHRDDPDGGADYIELPEGAEVARVRVHPDHVGRTLFECQIRTNHRVTVLNVLRKDVDDHEMRVVPDSEFALRAGDSLIVIGDLEALAKWRRETEGGGNT